MSSLNRMSDPNLIQFSHVNLIVIHSSSALRPNQPYSNNLLDSVDDREGITDGMSNKLGCFWRFWRFLLTLKSYDFFEEILIWVRSFLICNKRFKKEIFQPVLWHAVSSSHKIRPSSWPIKSYLAYKGVRFDLCRKLPVSSLIQVRFKIKKD